MRCRSRKPRIRRPQTQIVGPKMYHVHQKILWHCPLILAIMPLFWTSGDVLAWEKRIQLWFILPTFTGRNTSEPVSGGQTPHTLWPHKLISIITGKVCNSTELQVVQNAMSIHWWTRVFTFDSCKRISQYRFIYHILSVHVLFTCSITSLNFKPPPPTHTHTRK